MPRHLTPQNLSEQHRAQPLAARLDLYEQQLEASQLLAHVATALIEHYLQPLAQRLANECGMPGTTRLYLSGQHTVRVELVQEGIPLPVGRLPLRALADRPEQALGELLYDWRETVYRPAGYSPEPRSYWQHLMDED